MVSDCCGADIMESGLCSSCREHCESLNEEDLNFEEIEDECK